MAWIVTAWKPEVLAAAEREGVRLPEPGRRFPRGEPEPPAAAEHQGRATMRDSPLADLFRPTS
jgi:hypothetical protein